ncbi:hypothetical protein AVEN_174309-1 [Araneus ventricosus]|uniref:Uncharacterized protein n=1 Tax=Araneus ventricosus TaxID=182803 RepID=A0A4Y2NYZ6_ARAVE|nr:hypothetical protein AVEN_174309-1 [Araneus ventricosus]
MAAQRPCCLSPEEIVQLLQDLYENESDAEEHSIDFDMGYEPPQNSESKASSSDSEERMDKQSSGKNIQPFGVYSANISSSVLAASTSAEARSSNGKGRGSKRKNYSSHSEYRRGRGCHFQNHKEGSIYISKDRTSWTVTSASHTTVGKYGAQNVLKEIPGSKSYAKRNVGENVSSVWRLFMDESILRHIKNARMKMQF